MGSRGGKELRLWTRLLVVMSSCASEMHCEKYVPLIPVYRRPKVPPGCILINEKWQGNRIAKQLTDSGKGHYSDDLGVIDFCPSESVCVLYIPEEELLNDDYEYKYNIFTELQLKRPVIIAIRNVLTVENFSKLQDSCLHRNQVLYPLGNHSELCRFLLQMAYVESQPFTNPFKKRRKMKDTPVPLQLKLFLLIPGIGKKKADLLLNHFGCSQGLAAIPEEQFVRRLVPIIGKIGAEHAYNFFYNRIQVSNKNH